MLAPIKATQHDLALRTSIRRRLDIFDARFDVDAALTPAAVAIVISQHSATKEACIYLTLRSSSLRKHPGQFALPGGKIDVGESVCQAALRELSEELGLKLEEGQVLGRLDDFQTRSGFVISPVVIWNDSTDPLVINVDEVDTAYEITFAELMSDQLAMVDDSQNPPMFSIAPATIGHNVYSPTAAIIYQFREVLLLGKSTRVAHFAQPAFAQR